MKFCFAPELLSSIWQICGSGSNSDPDSDPDPSVEKKKLEWAPTLGKPQKKNLVARPLRRILTKKNLHKIFGLKESYFFLQNIATNLTKDYFANSVHLIIDMLSY